MDGFDGISSASVSLRKRLRAADHMGGNGRRQRGAERGAKTLTE